MRPRVCCVWKRSRPARIAKVHDRHGHVGVGRPANLCVVDLAATWTVNAAGLASKARNTPYAERTLTGVVRHTVFNGVATVKDAIAQR